MTENVIIFSPSNCSSDLTLLLSHSLSAQFLPQPDALITWWDKLFCCVIGHGVTNVSTSWLSLKLWPPRFRFSAGNTYDNHSAMNSPDMITICEGLQNCITYSHAHELQSSLTILSPAAITSLLTSSNLKATFDWVTSRLALTHVILTAFYWQWQDGFAIKQVP